MFKKIALPVVAGFIMAALVLTLVIFISDMLTGPEDVAAEYLRACMYQDVEAMVKYSSDYNKAVLNGGTLPSDGHLKDKLKSIYSQADSIYDGKEITFGIAASSPIEDGTAEYEEVYLTYSSLADFESVSEVYSVELNVYVGGTKQQTSRCILIKQGGYWRFAYQH